MVAVAEALLKYETLTFDEVDHLMKGERIDKPTVAELLSAEADKTAESTPPPSNADDRDEGLGGMMPSPA